MKSLKLNAVQIPEHLAKDISNEVYAALTTQGLCLVEDLEQLRQDPSRTPISVRFRLDPETSS